LQNNVISFPNKGYNPAMSTKTSYDVAVIGAGVFGVCTAYSFQQSGASVVLVDAFGPGNSRSSSGGETRIIRMGYGPDEIYSHSAQRSFQLWQSFFQRTNTSHLFKRTGVLWLARHDDSYCEANLSVLSRLGIKTTRLGATELRESYPQFKFEETTWGLLEPESGAMLARQAVQTVAAQFEKDGGHILVRKIEAPSTTTKLNSIQTSDSQEIFADNFIFACGPWLPRIFPQLLGDLFYVTRQEVFFFGSRGGDQRFADEQAPVWIDFNEFVYAIPDIEHRGFKIAIDAHGPSFDPDNDDRVATTERLEQTRSYLRKRIPLLADAPVLESRVCQYENTSNGDFLIDRHPEIRNVWLVGGGSGHGFKHGPSIGEYVVQMVASGGSREERFTLASKGKVQRRAVF
jgi:monomeric sarcosine oxidase